MIAALKKRGVKLILDVGLFIGFIVEFVTREPDFDPDYLLHSWTGIVLIPIIAFHLAGNWRWVTRVARNGRSDREFTLGVVNVVLGVLTAVCTVTGFPLWLDWSAAAWLSVTHQVTGLAAILLMFVHLWMNRRRVVALAKPRRANRQPA